MLLLSVENKDTKHTKKLSMNTKRKATEESKKVGNKSKVPKVGENVGETTFNSKQPLKKDLICQLSDLQSRFASLEKNFKDVEDQNKALETKNDENLKLIQSLKKRLECMTNEKEMVAKETQTVRGIELNCNECNFEAPTSTEFSSHLGEIHGWSEDQIRDELDMAAGPRYCKKCEFEAAYGYELDGHVWSEHDEDDVEQIECQFCDQIFSELKDLMAHKKVKHLAKVSLCRNFDTGSCIYGEQNCWFRHSVEEKPTINCSFCDKTFESIALFMRHRKSEHIERVKVCRKNVEENCPFSENCWFIHENIDKKENENENKTIQKLFDIVEKYTAKVINFEETLMKK